MSPLKVGVNGYGVIGRRVADAVMLQPDMELVGVADVATDYRVRLALGRGYPIYGATTEAAEAMTESGTGDLLLLRGSQRSHRDPGERGRDPRHHRRRDGRSEVDLPDRSVARDPQGVAVTVASSDPHAPRGPDT